jgi:hypothetical protein
MKLKSGLVILAVLLTGCGLVYSGSIAAASSPSPKSHPVSAKIAKSHHPAKLAVFHPVIKPYIPDAVKPKITHAALNKPVVTKVKVAAFHPVIKPYIPDAVKPAKKQLAIKVKKTSVVAQTDKTRLPRSKQQPAAAALMLAQLNTDAINSPVKAVKRTVSMADVNHKSALVTNLPKPSNTSHKPVTVKQVAADNQEIINPAAVIKVPLTDNTTKLVANAEHVTSQAATAEVHPHVVANNDHNKEDAVKVVSGDLSKNELFIFAANDHIPETLVAKPDVQMAVFGGDNEETAKKMVEFKVATSEAAARDAAVRDALGQELASKETTARRIATEEAATNKLAVTTQAMSEEHALPVQSKADVVGKVSEQLGKPAQVDAVENVNNDNAQEVVANERTQPASTKMSDNAGRKVSKKLLAVIKPAARTTKLTAANKKSAIKSKKIVDARKGKVIGNKISKVVAVNTMSARP